MSEQTLAQKRAADALKKILELKKNPNRGKYDSYVDSLPATILMSGLGQATATLLASAKLGKTDRSNDNKAYETLYRHLSCWLCRTDDDAPYEGKSELIDAICGGDEEDYLHAQAEALAYLEWLKKFSNAYLKDKS